MSKQKKARKERRPNIATTTINVPMAAGQDGAEFPRTPVVERKTTGAVFDYSHVKKDLTRIGILAGSFIAVFVILSFFLNR